MKTSILRFHFFLSALAPLLLLFNGSTVRADESCARLTDVESPFRSSFTQIGSMLPGSGDGGNSWSEHIQFDFSSVESDFETIDILAPWLSQCAASVDVVSVAMSILASGKLQSCYAEIEEHAKSVDTDSASGSMFADFVCPLYTETIVPCVNDVFVGEILLPAIQNPCCDELKSVVQRELGADLPTEIRSLSKLVGNVLCSIKTFTDNRNGQVANQTCGDALAATFVNSTDGSVLAETLDDALQIPTDQVCAAVMGEEVLLASGKKTTFPAGPNGANFGICYQPMSELVDHVSAYPLVHNVTMPGLNDSDIPLSALFAPNACVPVTSVYMGLLHENSFVAQSVGVVMAITDVIITGVSSVDTDASSSDLDNDSGDDGFDDSNWSIARGTSDVSSSISAWLLRSATGIRTRMLQTVESWTILIDTSSSSEGSDAGSIDKGVDEDVEEDVEGVDGDSADFDDPKAEEWPWLTLPTIDSDSPDEDTVYFPVCLHLPHGVPCDFGSSSITLAYPEPISK